MTPAERKPAYEKKREAVILVHNYLRAGVKNIADFIVDGLELPIQVKKTLSGIIILCGVDFIAGTAKILNPVKSMLLPARDAKYPITRQPIPPTIRENSSLIAGLCTGPWLLSRG